MRRFVPFALALLAGCPGLIASDSATEGGGATTTTTGGTPTTTLPDLTTTAFNVVVVGYTTGATTSAYAYPGGMNLKKIYDP